MRTNPLFLNSVLPGGTTAEKLVAARAAGLAQVELWTADVEGFPGGVASSTRRVWGRP